MKSSTQINSSPLRLAIVAPCYNEAEVLPISLPKLFGLLDELVSMHGCHPESYIVLVDDGSRDATWKLIESASASSASRLVGIKLSRNAGHQYALMAGLTYATGKCDAVISIDVDLQDDLAALPRMIAEYRNGAEIVLGVKESRADDPFTKTLTALMFYRLMRWMGVDMVENHADCRLMSSVALNNLAQFPEYFIFLRGLQPLLHSNIATVSYKLSPRPAGESKYPFRKMLALAWNGITSFSIAPLRLISFMGGLVFLVSLALALSALLKALTGETLPGWASITVPLYLLGGMLMLSIGIVGEYVAKIFLEVKRRPRYLIDRVAHGSPTER
jgi:polyisoprenyl-phosphate glycosyltransferase